MRIIMRVAVINMLRSRVNDLFAESTRRTHPELVEEAQRDTMTQPAEGLAQITLGMAMRPDRAGLLPEILTPTLVLCGEEDTVSPPSVMREMAALIPGARFQLIPLAGHLSPLEHPAAFNQAVRTFLQSLQ
jgi:pimeloyl-ACP methyl ester carboxylesterase